MNNTKTSMWNEYSDSSSTIYCNLNRDNEYLNNKHLAICLSLLR